MKARVVPVLYAWAIVVPGGPSPLPLSCTVVGPLPFISSVLDTFVFVVWVASNPLVLTDVIVVVNQFSTVPLDMRHPSVLAHRAGAGRLVAGQHQGPEHDGYRKPPQPTHVSDFLIFGEANVGH